MLILGLNKTTLLDYPEHVVSDYIEREISEYKKVTQQELEANGITPEAKEAFSRKPYYGMTGNFVKKPRINK